MNGIMNFIKGLFCETESDIIGLSRFGKKEETKVTQKPQLKKECTLTEMLRRTY